jgi:hypothetical protein
MIALTLLVKAQNFGQVKQIEELLKTQFEELDVEFKVLSNSVNSWVQVSLSGEDENIAASFIKKEIGTCPRSLDNVKKAAVLKGYVSKLDLAMQEITVDVGIFEPKVILLKIHLATLRKQLVVGKGIDLKKIAETYGFAERSPLIVKLVSQEDDVLKAELASEQVKKLYFWQQSLLDRLIILGASKETIESVLKRTRLSRDVIDIEILGLFEHALVCKLGTKAAGLVGIIGRYLKNSVFVVFNAQRSLNSLSNNTLTL